MGKKEDELMARLLMIMLLKDYVNYLSEIKEKDFNEKFQKQLEKDSELSNKDFSIKYKPLWLKMKSDTEFDKYFKERPLTTCDCGSANVSCIGLGEYDKEFDIQAYKWKCFSCNEEFEVSVNEKGETYKNGKK